MAHQALQPRKDIDGIQTPVLKEAVQKMQGLSQDILARRIRGRWIGRRGRFGRQKGVDSGEIHPDGLLQPGDQRFILLLPGGRQSLLQVLGRLVQGNGSQISGYPLQSVQADQRFFVLPVLDQRPQCGQGTIQAVAQFGQQFFVEGDVAAQSGQCTGHIESGQC